MCPAQVFTSNRVAFSNKMQSILATDAVLSRLRDATSVVRAEGDVFAVRVLCCLLRLV